MLLEQTAALNDTDITYNNYPLEKKDTKRL